ncbi:MAG: hydrogenase nickel incorporation protein HypB [Faecousia sp.]
MEKVRTITLSKSVFADNDRQAELLREYLRSQGVLLVNVMSSPGAGKTCTLIALIRALSPQYRIGVMEADIDSNVDAVSVAEKTGCRSIQLHTGGMCHLDASMTWQGLNELGLEGLDIVFLENVGNLVCPAEYDTGALLDMTILSVPEGDDKPLKYPLIYQKCGLVLINKIDTLAYFRFSLERCTENIRFRNPNARIIPISAKTGENIPEAAAYFREAVQNIKEERLCRSKVTK